MGGWGGGGRGPATRFFCAHVMSHARAVAPVLLSPLGGHTVGAATCPRRLNKLPLGDEKWGGGRVTPKPNGEMPAREKPRWALALCTRRTACIVLCVRAWPRVLFRASGNYFRPLMALIYPRL